MAELGRKEAEQLIKEILTEYARKIRSAKKKEYTADVQPLFSPDIDAFYKLVKSEDMDLHIFNKLNDEGIRHLLNDSCRLAKCFELDSCSKIKDFTYEPESPKCRITADSDGKYTAGGSYTFTIDGKESLGKKWYEPYSVTWHFYRENSVTRKYEEVVSAMSEARALVDFDTWDRSFLVSEKGRYKVTATIFNQAITTGIRPDIVEVCELNFEAEEGDVANLSYTNKIRIAVEYSNVSNEILEEIGDLNKLAIQLAGVFLVMAVLTASGLGAVAEALGIVLLVTSAAISGTQLLAGIIELKDFLSKVNDAKTDDDLKACGKIFGDAVAKIGVDGLFFVLSMFGLKKASAKLTTRTVVDNGLNAKKWAGKKLKNRELNIDEKSPEDILRNAGYKRGKEINDYSAKVKELQKYYTNEELTSIIKQQKDNNKAAKYVLDEMLEKHNTPKIDGLFICDGKVDGKIPTDKYKEYRVKSIHNPESNEMTFGRYDVERDPVTGKPIKDADGNVIRLPSNYIEKAGDTTYFDLGNDWEIQTKEYRLDHRGKQLFNYYNRPAIDDAINNGKQLRFCHDPRKNHNCALEWEWEHIKNKMNIDDADKALRLKKDGFWYVTTK
ncbi:MAG: hypothetical protein IJ530_04345 [Treponema sp.]|uniref:hypothetical protein n=1 Tax=Treponema sp. TaxID=166 RepID=UPI0025CFB88E|nr:hypothetical protein [Treponema sp.]MBQ8678975.1 hypothetical protein [Treponema sp.]